MSAIKNGKKIDVDDWPTFMEVGDMVKYRFKKWKIVKKMSDTWHADKPTFILERGIFFKQRIEV